MKEKKGRKSFRRLEGPALEYHTVVVLCQFFGSGGK
jgi:hypothetical protein